MESSENLNPAAEPAGLLTPRQLAQALGVSESSLKRWCDKGLISTLCTPGGHRRIPLSGAMEFIRAGQRPLVCPEVLGLPANAGNMRLSLDLSRQQLTQALTEGDETAARQVVMDAFLRGQSTAVLCDKLLCPALQAIGEAWECGKVPVYKERLSCGICKRLLTELRSLLPAPARFAPLAIGGTPAGDIYEIPTSAVELVLREAGWNATSLGSSLPFDTLTSALRDHTPRIFWLSVSHLPDAEAFLAELADFTRAAEELKTLVVVGGYAVSPAIRERLGTARYCTDMECLLSLVKAGNGPAKV